MAFTFTTLAASAEAAASSAKASATEAVAQAAGEMYGPKGAMGGGFAGGIVAVALKAGPLVFVGLIGLGAWLGYHLVYDYAADTARKKLGGGV